MKIEKIELRTFLSRSFHKINYNGKYNGKTQLNLKEKEIYLFSVPNQYALDQCISAEKVLLDSLSS